MIIKPDLKSMIIGFVIGFIICLLILGRYSFVSAGEFIVIRCDKLTGRACYSMGGFKWHKFRRPIKKKSDPVEEQTKKQKEPFKTLDEIFDKENN